MEIASAEVEHILLVVMCLGTIISGIIGKLSGVKVVFNHYSTWHMIYVGLVYSITTIAFLYSVTWLVVQLPNSLLGG